MTSKLGWNSSTPVNQPPNPPPQHPPHAYNTPTYPPLSNSVPPPSAPYYPTHSQDPPPYRTALSTFYVNDPLYSPSAPSTPHSPPPPYDELNNNNYPNFAYPAAQPPPPVQPPHQPQYLPIPRHQDNRNGNPPAQPPHSTAQPYDNRGSSVHRSLYGDSRRQIPDENFNHDNQRIYPDISNHRTQSYKSHHHHHNETPLPPNSVLLWEGSRPIRIYFVQQEGYVVSPDKDLKFTAYKLPPGNARNASVLVKADNCWRLGLSKERSYIVRGVQGEFAFFDDSTSPARCVVIVFQNQLKKEEKQRLDVLLTGCSQTSNEPSNAVDRFESGFGSAYDSFTDSFDNMIKKQTPGIHKNTNWLRKNTGQAVRFGGSLVSKGIHFVSDSHIDKTKPKEATNRHYEIFNALRFYRIAIEKKQVSRVTSYS